MVRVIVMCNDKDNQLIKLRKWVFQLALNTTSEINSR